MNVVTSFHHLLAGNEFTIVTEHQPLMYLMTRRTPIKRQLRWGGFGDQFLTEIVYRPGQCIYLANAFWRLYTEDKKYPHTAQHSTQEDSEYDNSLLTHFIKSNLANMARFETREVEYSNHLSDCNSNFSIHQAALDLNDYTNKSSINL